MHILTLLLFKSPSLFPIRKYPLLSLVTFFILKLILSDVSISKEWGEEVQSTEPNDVLDLGDVNQTYWYGFKIWSLVGRVGLFVKARKREETIDMGFEGNEFDLEYYEFKDEERIKASLVATLELQ